MYVYNYSYFVYTKSIFLCLVIIASLTNTNYLIKIIITTLLSHLTSKTLYLYNINRGWRWLSDTEICSVLQERLLYRKIFNNGVASRPERFQDPGG